METRKLNSNKIRFGIPLLILFFSLPSIAMEVKKIGFDVGLSGSIAYADLDGGQLALGNGYQASVFSSWDIGKAWDLKIQFDSITLQQSFLNEASLGAKHKLIEIQQRYHLILIGAEVRKKTWFWEVFSGVNIGRDSSYKVKDSASGQNFSSSSKTKSFLLAGFAIAYHWKSNDLGYIARLKSFSLLSNVYDGSLGERDFYFSLPLMLSLGMEF